MPEGDTIHNAARRVGAALVGKPIETIETPQRRHAMDRWPERLDGRGVRSVDAHGKHLFLRFEGDLTLHSHLRMGGAWGGLPPRTALAAQPAPRLARDPHAGARGGAVRRTGARADDRLAHALRPAAREPRPGRAGARSSTSAAFLRRLREDDQTRGIADALLDQRNLAGIGNLWKAEACFLAGREPVAAGSARCRTSWPSRSWRASGRSCSASADGRLPAARSLGVRAPRPARAGAATRSSRPAARATTTAPPTGAPPASHDPRGPQGRRPRGAGQHRRELPGRARARRGHDRVRRPADPRRTAGARARLRGRRSAAMRSRSTRGSTTWPASEYAHLQLDVDLKLPGYEREVVDGLERARPGRALARVDDVRREPRPAGRAAARAAARLVGAAREARLHALGAGRCPPTAVIRWMRARLPAQAAARIRAGGCEAIMAHRLLVGAAPRPGACTRRAARCTCGPWTTPRRIRAFEALGVDGVITNDPRLFDGRRSAD